MTGSTPEIRAYRWVICAMSFLIMFVGQGMFFGGISVFDLQLINSLSEMSGQDVAKADIKLRDTLMLLRDHDAASLSGRIPIPVRDDAARSLDHGNERVAPAAQRGSMVLS